MSSIIGAGHEQPNVERYVGLSLGGGKSDRTTVTVIDYYRKQCKAFVIDVYESVGAHDDYSADEVLLEILSEFDIPVKVLAVDAPLTLPPCVNGCRKGCKGMAKCVVPEVRWMRNQFKKAHAQNKKLKQFTSYSQRPVDLFFRYRHLDQSGLHDETMGANQAPRAARMQYLKSHISAKVNLIEVWPKLTLFYVHKLFNLTRNQALSYRQLDEGIHIREHVVQSFIDDQNLFIYERDSKRFATSISAFDSLICAWAALNYGLGRCIEFRKDLPLQSGWIQIPKPLTE